MPKKLTAVSLTQIKPGQQRREIADGGCAGLYLVVQTTGQRSWAVRYRSPIERDKNGQRKAKKFTLGPLAGDEGAPAESAKVGDPLTLAAARLLAASALDKVMRGIDPTHERRAARQAAKLESIAAANDDIKEVFAKFMNRYAKVHTRPSSWTETQRIFDGRILSKWRGRGVQHIAKRDVIELLDDVVDDGAPILANRVLAVVRRFFNWCLERDILAVSPCAGVKPPSPERSRDRVLTDDELVALWQVADEEGYAFGCIAKLLILTGQRVDEVRCAPWSEFDLKNRIWSIPGNRAKNGRDHDVPLSAAAIEILEQLPKFRGGAGFLFSTTTKTPVSGTSKAKDRFEQSVLKKLRKKDPRAKAPERWTFHDLRRTFYSGLQRLGFPIEVAEAVVNHISGTRRGVAGVYGRHQYADEKRAALDAWGKFVTELVNPTKHTNVVRIRAGEAVGA